MGIAAMPPVALPGYSAWRRIGKPCEIHLPFRGFPCSIIDVPDTLCGDESYLATVLRALRHAKFFLMGLGCRHGDMNDHCLCNEG